MNAVLLIAHAPLAHALRECALHVFADAGDDIGALDVDAHEPPEQTLARAQALRARWGERPVLVLTDVLGATPCNVARRLADGEHTQLLAGVNLPPWRSARWTAACAAWWPWRRPPPPNPR